MSNSTPHDAYNLHTIEALEFIKTTCIILRSIPYSRDESYEGIFFFFNLMTAGFVLYLFLKSR